MIAQKTSNKLSRRNWLRNATITTTGVAVMPSLLTGCTDHPIHPTLGVGAPQDVPLTTDELAKAAQNLSNMVLWLMDIHAQQSNYEIDMYMIIKGGKERPSGWSDFITNILLDIAVGIIGAAAAVAETVTAGAASAGIIAGLALTTELVKKLTAEDVGGNLEGVIGEFMTGQDNLYKKTKDALSIMSSDTDNYSALKEAFKGGAINFNGKQYTLSDLAKADFPYLTTPPNPIASHKGEVYVALQDAAMLQFKKYFWNVMIAKAGSMKSSVWYVDEFEIFTDNLMPPTYYGRKTHYTEERNKSTYLRGYYYNGHKDQGYYFSEWLLTFDGRELSPAAGKELFKDDTPGNIINPNGLFLRDYVFKQFHREKPNFGRYHDLRKDLDWGPNGGDAHGFDLPDDFKFTGGEFHELIKK